MREDVNIAMSRDLMVVAQRLVKQYFPKVHLQRQAWTWHAGRGHWEFHGPDKFYWHGRAANAYHARYQGWTAWLRSKGINDL